MRAALRAIEKRRELERDDPVLLARRAGFNCDPYQEKVLRSSSSQIILCSSRQVGKSTVTALLALHTALYRAPAVILLLSPSLRQSQELFRKIKNAITVTRENGKVAEESLLRIEFTNDSRIVCLPGKEATIRGFSAVSLLVVDEAAYVADQLYASIRPMLAVSRGRIVLLSTPHGREGFFWETWHSSEEWDRIHITAYDCDRISRAWLDTERNLIPEQIFRREYLAEFLQADSVFRFEDVELAFTSEIRPIEFVKRDKR